MPRVSVIITSYCHARFLSAAVEGLLRQRFSNWQAVIVDDGSPDDSLAVASNLAAGDPRIVAVGKPNGGVGDARNFGLRHCDPASDYICVLDGDDFWAPDFLERMVSRLDADPQAVAITCGFRLVNEDGKDLGAAARSRIVPGRFGWPVNLKTAPLETPFVAFYCGTGQGPYALFKRSAYTATVGWTTEFSPHEDTDFLCQIALQGRVAYDAGELYLKRVHPAQVTAGGHIGSRRVPRDAYHLFRRRWCRWQARNAYEARTLTVAHRWYMRVFRPLRDGRVALRASWAAVQQRQWRHLRWAAYLCWRLSGDLLRYHVLRREPDRPSDIERFPLGIG